MDTGRASSEIVKHDKIATFDRLCVQNILLELFQNNDSEIVKWLKTLEIYCPCVQTRSRSIFFLGFQS